MNGKLKKVILNIYFVNIYCQFVNQFNAYLLKKNHKHDHKHVNGSLHNLTVSLLFKFIMTFVFVRADLRAIRCVTRFDRKHLFVSDVTLTV